MAGVRIGVAKFVAAIYLCNEEGNMSENRYYASGKTLRRPVSKSGLFSRSTTSPLSRYPTVKSVTAPVRTHAPLR